MANRKHNGDKLVIDKVEFFYITQQIYFIKRNENYSMHRESVTGRKTAWFGMPLVHWAQTGMPTRNLRPGPKMLRHACPRCLLRK